MALPKFALVPSQSGYAAQGDSNTLRAKLSGGPGRFRLDMIGSVATVAVQWRCTRFQMNYLEAFFRSAVPGSQPFLIDLILDSADPVEYEARLVPDSRRLSGVQGNLRVIDAQLEVKPQPINVESDLAMVAIYGAYGESGPSFFNLLDQLVNVDLPPI